MSMLTIENLTVKVSNRVILQNFSLNIDKGEVHVLLGPNGAGKSTLIKAILGMSDFKIEQGKIIFRGEDITTLPINERIQRGIGVLFQNPPAINGVKLHRLLTVCSQRKNNGLMPISNNCEDEIDPQIIQLGNRLKLPPSYLERDINVGFSGGEVKRSEILQMMVLQPDFLMFDEPDSGVDVENVELIANIMRELLDRDKIPSKQQKSGLIITHLGYILKFLGHITRAHVMMDGRIQCSGNPNQIITSIMKNGFEGCRKCSTCEERELKEGELFL